MTVHLQREINDFLKYFRYQPEMSRIFPKNVRDPRSQDPAFTTSVCQLLGPETDIMDERYFMALCPLTLKDLFNLVTTICM
jgi:hypothetical protein